MKVLVRYTNPAPTKLSDSIEGWRPTHGQRILFSSSCRMKYKLLITDYNRASEVVDRPSIEFIVDAYKPFVLEFTSNKTVSDIEITPLENYSADAYISFI